MANDKHRTAREARQRWDAELFEKWQREHGVEPPKDRQPSGVLSGTSVASLKAVANEVPFDAASEQMIRAAKAELERRREEQREAESPVEAEAEPEPPPPVIPFPIEWITKPPGVPPSASSAKYGLVLYSDGSLYTLTADRWELAEARFAEVAIQRPDVVKTCMCMGESKGNCGTPHEGSIYCKAEASVYVVHHAMCSSVREDMETSFPTCIECAVRFVGRYGTMLLVDFLQQPPVAETFEYLRAVAPSREDRVPLLCARGFSRGRGTPVVMCKRPCEHDGPHASSLCPGDFYEYPKEVI